MTIQISTAFKLLFLILPHLKQLPIIIYRTIIIIFLIISTTLTQIRKIIEQIKLMETRTASPETFIFIYIIIIIYRSNFPRSLLLFLFQITIYPPKRLVRKRCVAVTIFILLLLLLLL